MRPCCNPSPTRELAPEELPTLPIRATSPVATLVQLAGVTAEFREPRAVGGDQFAEADLEGVLEGRFHGREVAVLDQLFELASTCGGELHGRRGRRPRVEEQRADGFGSVRELVVGAVALESVLFLGAEADPKESTRRRVVRFGHPFNEN